MEECKFVLIKIIEGTTIYNNAKKYLSMDREFKYFNLTGVDLRGVTRACILLCNNEKIQQINWCECNCRTDEKGPYLSCKKLYSSSSEVVIANACDSIFLDINNDFKNDYMAIESSLKLYKQFEQLETSCGSFEKLQRNYILSDKENGMHILSQRNEYCKRQYNLKAPTEEGRSEYQRDYDRIIYSKSFRRIVDKTQVFSATKGDHYRTRMTHTMIVCQIARSICNALNLNQALTEAIAIGHDLGHTPFGHVGERTLNDILIERFPEVGGFKHNYQGLRVVSMLEKDYYEIDGLDLSYQVLEGIFKHTKQKDGVEISEFVNDDELIDYLHLEYPCSITLEGQIVSIADEIAQRSHDIDDAFASNLLSFDEFLSYLKLSKFEELAKEIEAIEKRKAECKNKIISDNNELFAFQISSAIVKYFIADVIKTSGARIIEYIDDHRDDFSVDHIIKEKLIAFSENGELICNYLEKMLNNKVLGSTEVSVSDQNSAVVVESLFNAYYNNPQLLHNGTKRKIYSDFIKNNNIENIIDLVGGSPIVVKKEFENIRKAIDEEYTAKQKILVRDICDYISGMTDSYAIAEYNKICKSL